MTMKAPLPVTVVIPVLNEEKNLAECLARLHRFARVVVIDSGSTDTTPDIARAAGAELIRFEWNGRYPKKRNWFLINTPPETEWVLFLDADEYVNDAFVEALGKAVQQPRYAGFWLHYTNYFLGRPLRHGLAQRKLALFRVGSGLYERIDEAAWSALDMEVHEHPILNGEVGEITAPIDHRDLRGIDKFIDRHRDYARWEARRYLALHSGGDIAPEANAGFSARQRFKYRHLARWWYPWFVFGYTFFVKAGFFDGVPGFYHAFYKCWYFVTVRLMIRERR